MPDSPAPWSCPTISIVTPCLNAAGTIEEALESVRAQGYPRLEHLVVDGGSTDGTIEMLERLGVRCVSEPDDGPRRRREQGRPADVGDVIGWLNADDRYEPGALQAVGRRWPPTRRRVGHRLLPNHRRRR